MLTPELLSEEQNKLIDRLYENDINFVYAGMGFGKSCCTLSALDGLLSDKVLERVLIVAPLKACSTVWAVEHEKWSHLTHLKVSLALGTPEKRRAAIEDINADIVVINFENLVWLLNSYKELPFDGIVLDEISKLKDNSSKIVKKLRYRLNGFKWRVGLTGTPVNENFSGLFSQVLCLDGGYRYGRNKQVWLDKYFFSTDYEQRNWDLREGKIIPLIDRIDDILYAVPDYSHELKPLVESHQYFDLPESVKTEYSQFKRDSIFSCMGEAVIAESAAVLSGKLEQFASGFLYLEDKTVYPLHESRLNALTDYLAEPLNYQENILIFYHFQADKDRLIEYFQGEARLLDSAETEADWNSGNIRIMLAHPLSAGHGLNLMDGGARILFYTPTWSNDQQKQCIARLWRRSQKFTVVATTLIARNTINELTVKRIEDKEEYDAAFKRHLD